MPSTVVHVALGGFLAAALLGDEFDGRALLVVLGATALPDLDTLLGIWIRGGHRAILHNALIPVVVAGLLYYDLAVRERSVLRSRWGDRGGRVAWAALAGFAVAGVAPDLFYNGANLFYPLHDQFYALDGELLVSNQRGVVQTFVEVDRTAQQTGGTAVGSTEVVHYSTGFDAAAGEDPEQVERVFPIVQSGQQAVLVLASAFVNAVRLRESHNR